MKTALAIPLLLVLFLDAGHGIAQAQSPASVQQGTRAPAPARPGAAAAPTGAQANLQAGQQLATSGAPNGVTACAGCHGAQGEGNPAGAFPRIGGQGSYYLGKQLAAYANGARVNPIMAPIAKAMNAQQIRDVSAYYATLGGASQAPAAAKGGARGSARALQLVMSGDGVRQVQACVNCHGPGGAGEPPIFPYLAGQHASYLNATMAQWKKGERKTDQSGQMPHIARALADADIAALSAYYSALPPPPPAARLVNLPAGSSLKPTVAAAPGAPGPKAPGGAGVSGSGTEQGAPLTGGSQGSGGGGGTQGTLPPTPPDKR